MNEKNRTCIGFFVSMALFFGVAGAVGYQTIKSGEENKKITSKLWKKAEVFATKGDGNFSKKELRRFFDEVGLENLSVRGSSFYHFTPYVGYVLIEKSSFGKPPEIVERINRNQLKSYIDKEEDRKNYPNFIFH